MVRTTIMIMKTVIIHYASPTTHAMLCALSQRSLCGQQQSHAIVEDVEGISSLSWASKYPSAFVKCLLPLLGKTE